MKGTLLRLFAILAAALCGTPGALAVGGGPLPLPTGPVTLDGSLDADYKLVLEDDLAAPDVGGSGQTTASDLSGESSANHVWFGFGDANSLADDNGLFVRGSGSADIQNVYLTWDLDYLYIAVVGPNAFDEGHGCCGDDMDLFVAIDTADSALTTTTPTLDRTQVPMTKGVDFAGWAPNYFAVVDAIGPSWHTAKLFAGLTEVASDTDAASTDATFDVQADWAAAVTEIRIAWSALGGKPDDATGATWNLAVYTTYEGDHYDTYDSAPGYGQGTVFEQLGDVACDSDHCSAADGGDGSVDPVSGAHDACDCVSEDDRGLGAGLSPTQFEQPGSDSTFASDGFWKDVDTLQAYFRVTNVGQIPDCDDGDVCTDDAWDPVNGCTTVHNTEPCDDNDACTNDDACAGGSCAGTPIVCDDGNVCTDDECDPSIGCTTTNNTAACNDGDACTDPDFCDEGQCIGGPQVGANDGNPCTDDSCDPALGSVYTPNSDPCDDGDPCTINDVCSDGVCTGPDPINTDDGNPCTDDYCDPVLGSVSTPNNDPCDDADPCTADDMCAEGSCAGAAIDCSDANDCTEDACDAGVCVHTNITGACDDGNACTTGETCEAGACGDGADVDCSDSEVCTDDACDPATGCFYADNTLACDDDDACTGEDVCAAGVCTGGPAVTCDDGNLCTDDTCDSATGCVYTPNQAPCDDEDECTRDDVCSDTLCEGMQVDCDDGEPCTIDSCDTSTGCVHTIDYDACGEADRDSDGLPDAWELEHGLDPDSPDSDGDGIADGIEAANEGEEFPPDTDEDGTVDPLDPDSDGDGIPDAEEAGDIASAVWPADTDDDGVPDYQDKDSDNDGIQDSQDNCRLVPNTLQEDADEDGVGDACEGDMDGDGVADEADNCPMTYNPDQEDMDGDLAGDACDADADGDGLMGDEDLCPFAHGGGSPDGCPEVGPDVGGDNTGSSVDGGGAVAFEAVVETDPTPSTAEGCDCRSGDEIPLDAWLWTLIVLGLLALARRKN